MFALRLGPDGALAQGHSPPRASRASRMGPSAENILLRLLEQRRRFPSRGRLTRERYGKLDLRCSVYCANNLPVQGAIMNRLFASAGVLCISAAVALTVMAAPGDPSGVTIEQLIDIKHPSNAAWSTDGRQVTFTWDRAGVSARYISDLDGRPPRELPGPAPAGGRGRGANAARADIDAVASPDGK